MCSYLNKAEFEDDIKVPTDQTGPVFCSRCHAEIVRLQDIRFVNYANKHTSLRCIVCFGKIQEEIDEAKAMKEELQAYKKAGEASKSLTFWQHVKRFFLFGSI